MSKPVLKANTEVWFYSTLMLQNGLGIKQQLFSQVVLCRTSYQATSAMFNTFSTLLYKEIISCTDTHTSSILVISTMFIKKRFC